MEKATGWVSCQRRQKPTIDIESWGARKAEVDMQHKLERLNREEKMIIKQIDATLARYRINFAKKRGLKVEDYLNSRSGPSIEGLSSVESLRSKSNWSGQSETQVGNIQLTLRFVFSYCFVKYNA